VRAVDNPAKKEEKPMALTIYHNPGCYKSRKTLEIIENAGIKPGIVDYLSAPPTAARILQIAGLLDIAVQDLLRRNEAIFKEAADLPDLTDNAALADWVAANPRVLERPIVVDDEADKAVLGRPPENVEALLPS
jgi:arsenate reductase